MTNEFTIREATPEDAQAIAEVHIASWRTSYKHIFPPEVFKNQTVEHRTAQWQDQLTKPINSNFLYVAENNLGMVVGFAWGGKHVDGVAGYEGELRAMYILEDYKKKGIGSRLFDAVTKRLLEEVMKSMLVCVLAENPSRSFYEKKGGKVIGDRLYEKEGKVYSALEYGWEDMQTLLDNEE